MTAQPPARRLRRSLALALRLRALGAMLAGLLLATSAAAQVATVNISVQDDQGLPQTFVDVRLEGADGNPNNYTDYTDDTGAFTFVGVPPGKYEASAFADGFVSDKYAVDIGPGAKQDIRIVLRRAEAQTEIVIVNANIAELVDPRVTDTSTKLTGEFINKIPLLNRNIQDIVAMIPGVIRVGASDSTEISIGGGTSSQIAYRVDGLSANDAFGGGLAFQLPTAAIQSFKLITNGASARYGEQSTGVAEIVTKSGGNENDFSYELQFRDSRFGAQGIDDVDAASKRVDDLFNARGSILEADLRAGLRLLGIDPISTTDDDNNPIPRKRVRQTVSAGGPIKRDVAFFHSTLEVVQDDYGSAFVDGMGQTDNVLWTAKVNWKLWEKNQASSRLEFTANLDQRVDDGFAAVAATESTDTLGSSLAWTLGATNTHVFANMGVLESKISFMHQATKRRPADVRKGIGPQYEIRLPPGGQFSYFTGQAGTNFDQTVDTIRAETTYSKAVGSRDQHTLEFGINADHTSFEVYRDLGADVIDFRILNDTNVFGTPGPLAGREIAYGPAIRREDSSAFVSAFVQDSWGVTDNLTLTMGLRADYQSFVGKVFLAPRVGFSLDPVGDRKTRFFGNWGIYYDRLFLDFLEFTERPDRTFSDIFFTTAFDGTQRRFSQTSIEDIYHDSLTRISDSVNSSSIAFRRATFRDRYVGADELTAPTTQAWALGISRELPGKVRVEVTYSSNSRTHQVRADVITRRNAINNDPVFRDIVYGTTGVGAFRQWSAEVGRPFGANSTMNLSYVQSRNIGPVGAPEDPIDPSDVFFLDGILGNDRTHVAKLQGTTKLGKGKKAWDASADFTWQSGLPVTASLLRDNGVRLEPIGRNSLRLPSTRMLNFGISKNFTLNTKEGGGFMPTVGFRAQFFNLLNHMNVVSAQALFESPGGISNPQSFPPLRPTILPLDVDVSRSLEVGFSVSF